MDPFFTDINAFLEQQNVGDLENAQQEMSWSMDAMSQFPHSSQSAESSTSFAQQSMSVMHHPGQPSSMGQTPAINIPENFPSNIIPLGAVPPQTPFLTAEQHASISGQQQQPMLDQNGQPIKIRKKPGRKPNPASPALRKAQNRAAQRAFRERKERHLRELENTIRTLREQRNNAVQELNAVKAKLDGYKAENWYLRGVVLTLQFVCLHHNIQIPNHSPYLTEEALSDMARTSPHAIEAYVNAYTRNNVDLKPTLASQLANVSKAEFEEPPTTYEEQTVHHEQLIREKSNTFDMTIDPVVLQRQPSETPQPTITETAMSGNCSARNNDLDVAKVKNEPEDETDLPNPPSPEKESSISSLGAIQRIRMQLRIQSTLTTFGNSSVRLQPTLLQLTIPHDPRIDLIPTPHMRDRMILFRDIMDYDRCFSMLLNGAVYHGGDPTLSESWELPAEFFSEFWYVKRGFFLVCGWF